MYEQKESKSYDPKKGKSLKVKPLKDHVIHHNDDHIELKKGEACEVPSKYLETLRTEKVIK